MRNQLPQKRGHSSPQFSVHICCGQTAGSIRMPLDMEVRLGPGRFVLMGSWAPALPLKGAQPPIFDPYLLWPNGWIKMPLGTQVGLGPGEVVLDGDLAPPTERGTSAITFRPMSIVAKRSPISATAELLLRYASGQTYKHADRKSVPCLWVSHL